MAIAQWQINFIKASEAFELSLFFIFFLFLWKKLIFVKQSNYVNWWFSIFYKRPKIVSSHHFNISFGAHPPYLYLICYCPLNKQSHGSHVNLATFWTWSNEKELTHFGQYKAVAGDLKNMWKKMGWELSN